MIDYKEMTGLWLRVQLTDGSVLMYARVLDGRLYWHGIFLENITGTVVSIIGLRPTAEGE